jgi:molecular chaperone HtpG
VAVFDSQLKNRKGFNVIFESLSENDQPVIITQSEYMRRMKDMSAMSGGGGMFGSFPDSYNLVVNTNHPLIEKMVEDKNKKLAGKLQKIAEGLSPLNTEKAKLEKDQKGKKEDEIPQAEKDMMNDAKNKIDGLNTERKNLLEEFGSKNKVLKQLIDLALLNNNMLKGEDLAKFVKRSVELIK